LEQAVTAPELQLAFLNKIQRLFAEGDFSASYKYALLIAIADIAVESGHEDNQPFVIPHRSLGAKFIDLYWQQSAPYRNNVLLIQNNGTQAAVISLIAQFRSKSHAATATSARAAVGFKSLLSKVTRIVVDKPVFHIQNLGGTKDQFLFESGTDSITLLPGVAYCLRRFQPLVQQLARSHWIGHVKRNKQNTHLLGQDNDLESFLFETSRQSLAVVQAGLRKISKRCFYCHREVHEADVDHFIPHALYPRDLVHNFVLADPACNRSKSDTLAAKPHLHRWLDFVQINADNLAQIGHDAGIMADAGSTHSVVRWGYTNAVTSGAQGWIRAAQYEPIDGNYLELWRQQAPN
jgi:5-methylcytosine-specific restriction endonuclease McrA